MSLQDVGTIGNWTPARLSHYVQNLMSQQAHDAKQGFSSDDLFVHQKLVFSSGDFTTADTKILRPSPGVLTLNGKMFLTVGSYSLVGAPTGISAGFTAGAGTTATSTSTYTGNLGATAYTVGDVINALKVLGLLQP